MPPTIRTIVDAAGDITAIETYQGPRGWVPITVAQEGPVIQRADVADLLTGIIDRLDLCRQCFGPGGRWCCYDTGERE